MLAKIKQLVRLRTLEQDDFLVALNREILPLLRSIRDALNSAVGDEISVPLVRVTYDPTAGTTTSYAAIDALSPTVLTGTTFLDADFPVEEDGRVRAVYFSVLGALQGASSSVSFALFDSTVASVVDGSELTTSSTSLVQLMSGALTLVDGHTYVAVSKRADGTGDALVAEAVILVRYE